MAGRITYLGETDKAAIYEAALEIMETVGQRVHHAEALELLRAAGCTVTDPDLVCIPRELVEQARATAPAHDRGLRPQGRAGDVAGRLQRVLRQRLGRDQRLRRGRRRASP